jgi:hypothetical protein
MDRSGTLIVRTYHRRRRTPELSEELVFGPTASRKVDDDPILAIVGMFDDKGPHPFGEAGEQHDQYLAEEKPRREAESESTGS